jgi:hypothetical protein
MGHEVGKKRKGEDEVRSSKRHVSDTLMRKETREGGSGTGTRAKIQEPTSVPGKEGRTVQWRGECGAMPRPREHVTRGPRPRWRPQNTQ